jgi:D-aspartate ligase
MTEKRAFACVFGEGVDLLQTAGLAGIPCVSVSPPGAVPRFSRFCRAAVTWHDPLPEAEALLKALLEFARTVGEPPVLFYQGDEDTLFVSRFRSELAPHFRFVIPEASLVEDLIDKDRFQAFAQRLELPVPPSTTLTPHSPPSAELGITFPALVKPIARQLATASWRSLAGHAKAVQVASLDELTRVWRQAASINTSLLVQQLIAGDENRIESYHVYVDSRGEVAGEFTGRKVRTFPRRFGHSSALEISAEEDVRTLGLNLVKRMGLRGVAKLDFKRDPGGKLYLLEANPRFNLWHHLGAVAGVNLPALVYADLTGTPRPTRATARPGVGWSKPLEDLRAVRAAGAPFRTWLSWTIGARATSGFAANDPMLLVGWAIRKLRRRARGRLVLPSPAPSS